MVEKFRHGNKWQCRILGMGGEDVVNGISSKPLGETCHLARMAPHKASLRDKCLRQATSLFFSK
jgi:hypothetical protein